MLILSTSITRATTSQLALTLLVTCGLSTGIHATFPIQTGSYQRDLSRAKAVELQHLSSLRVALAQRSQIGHIRLHQQREYATGAFSSALYSTLRRN